MKKTIKTTCAVATALLCISTSVLGVENGCLGLPEHAELQDALRQVVLNENNGGFNLHMWATIVNRDGVVCAVAFSGASRYSQRSAGRVMSAQKAYTANAFSLNKLALSTSNLYAVTQPGGSLFGLEESNPVATNIVYAGIPSDYGTAKDFMVGKKVGGISTVGGGLGLYANEEIIGAIGVSGDTSCADHNVAWKARDLLGLDNITAGVSRSLNELGQDNGDNIIFDVSNGASTSGFGHPTCLEADTNADSQTINNAVIVDAPLY